MRAIELNLQSILYSVTHEKIHVYPIKSISKIGNEITVKINDYNEFQCNPDDKVGKDGKTYYFDLQDAQKSQLRGRKALVASKFETMQKAQSDYNNCIELYFDKPASNPDDEN